MDVYCTQPSVDCLRVVKIVMRVEVLSNARKQCENSLCTELQSTVAALGVGPDS